MAIELPIAILITGGLATAGWIHASRRQRGLSRKQHTFDALLTTSLDHTYQRAYGRVSSAMRHGPCPDDLGKQPKLFHDLAMLLNFYEFMAAGLRNGDIDERLLRDSEGGFILALYRWAEAYVFGTRSRRERAAIYEHYEWLYDRWEAKPIGRMARAVEYIRLRPLYGRRKHR